MASHQIGTHLGLVTSDPNGQLLARQLSLSHFNVRLFEVKHSHALHEKHAVFSFPFFFKRFVLLCSWIRHQLRLIAFVWFFGSHYNNLKFSCLFAKEFIAIACIWSLYDFFVPLFLFDWNLVFILAYIRFLKYQCFDLPFFFGSLDLWALVPDLHSSHLGMY
jgi:hypothetical protein